MKRCADRRGQRLCRRSNVQSQACDWLHAATSCFSRNRPARRSARLSGGERGRLALAIALARPPIFWFSTSQPMILILRRSICCRIFLSDYPGTVLVVSHDRDFLDRVATSIISLDERGRWIEYAGGYSDMIAQRGARPPAPTASGHSDGASRRGPAPQARPPRQASNVLQGQACPRNFA